MLAAMLCMALAPAAASAAAPPNDDFAAAQPLITGVAATGDNTEAGTEAGEPVHSAWVAPNRSVWFTWTAPSAGLARISACGSAFDTVVAVYGGSSLAGIYATRIANNDNGCADSAQASMVHVRATAGTTYRIALDGWGGGDAGAYSIVADVLGDPGAPPANDGPDAAPVLAGAAVHATGTNAGATSGWNEWPADATQLVYWRWTSPVDGQVRVDTCASGFDTVLGVLRRTSDGMWNGGALARRGCGDRAAVTLDAVKGQEYWIGVGGEAGTSGAIDLRIDATPDVTPPMTTFSSAPGSPWGRRVAQFQWKVTDEAPTTSECALDAGEWYACSGGESVGALAEGEHVFQVRSTDVHGNAEDPPAEHAFTVVIPEAPNDAFADAVVLGPGETASVNNGKATAEPGEPSHDSWYFEQGLGAHFSVWYAFTPVSNGTAELDWCASGFDVVVAVYTGTAVGALQRVANREPPGCTDSLPVQGGTTYRIAVDGAARNLDYGTGPVMLSLAFAAEEPGPDRPRIRRASRRRANRHRRRRTAAPRPSRACRSPAPARSRPASTAAAASRFPARGSRAPPARPARRG